MEIDCTQRLKFFFVESFLMIKFYAVKEVSHSGES